MYDAEDLAPEQVDNSSWSLKMEAKRAAEEELDRRDTERARNRAQRLREAAHDIEDERELQRGRVTVVEEEEPDAEEIAEDTVLNIEAFDVPLRDWIAQERTAEKLSGVSKTFLILFLRLTLLESPLQRQIRMIILKPW